MRFKIPFLKWTVFIVYKLTSENVQTCAGEYLFDTPLQVNVDGYNYLTGIMTNAR